MGKATGGEFWESGLTNNAMYMLYYQRIIELSMAMFEWKNLPDTCDERFLELVLFAEGKALFFEDDELGKIATRCTINGHFDIYQIPKIREAIASNGYHKQLTDENSVIIYNNSLRTNSMLTATMYAKRLYELDRTIDVNVKAQKTPVLIACDENQRLTLKNVYMQYDGNQPVIYGDKKLRPDSLSVLSTGAPYVADKLQYLKTEIWNEVLTYLGITNVNFQKKERLISDEATRQQGAVIANRYSRLNARRQACEKINKMFGTNIECNFREDFREVDDEYMLDGDTGEGEMSPMVVDLRTRSHPNE